MMRKLGLALIVVFCCGALIYSMAVVFKHLAPTDPQGSDGGARLAEFDRAKYAPVRAVQQFPAIVNIPFKRCPEVKEEVKDEELILGVEVRGEYRAYSINQMTGPQREVFNDTLGGTAIAATW